MLNCTDLACVLHHHHFYAHLHHLKRHLDGHHDEEDEGKSNRFIYFLSRFTFFSRFFVNKKKQQKKSESIKEKVATWKRTLTVSAGLRIRLRNAQQAGWIYAIKVFLVLHIKWHLTLIAVKQQRQRLLRSGCLHSARSQPTIVHKKLKNSKVEKSLFNTHGGRFCWFTYSQITKNPWRRKILITTNDACNFLSISQTELHGFILNIN